MILHDYHKTFNQEGVNKMAIWYKQGVFGTLQSKSVDGLRKTERLYATHGEDVFVTSIQDGTHGAGSFHVSGLAWDMRKGDVLIADHKECLGTDFQIIDESNHRHVEFDPQ
jgi:hypothetical protein